MDDITEDQVVNVEEKKEVDWTESEEESDKLSRGPEKTKVSEA